MRNGARTLTLETSVGLLACERVGDGLVAAHIIARPHREVEPALGNGNYAGQKD